MPLFWCYEIASLGLVILYGGTAFFLRRKDALVLDKGNFSDQNFGLEMFEAPHEVMMPDTEKCMDEDLKAWMESSLLSSDEEDGPESPRGISIPN